MTDYRVASEIQKGFNDLEKLFRVEGQKNRMIKLMAQGLTPSDAKLLVEELDKLF